MSNCALPGIRDQISDWRNQARSATPSSFAFSLATARASGEMSTASPRLPGNSFSRESKIAPLPVPISRISTVRPAVLTGGATSFLSGSPCGFFSSASSAGPGIFFSSGSPKTSPARSAACRATASRSATSCCQAMAFSGSVSSCSFSADRVFTLSTAARASSAFFRQKASFSSWVRLFPVTK